MRLTPKKIEEILLGLLGPDGLPLVKELSGKENVSEFDLATRTKKDIKIIRKMLYTLYNHNLVCFTRKKDKIKGWYIYYWTLLPESIRFSYFKMRREMLEKLHQQLEEERKELFFICISNCVRLNFDQAMEFEFHCPECGKLVEQDNRNEKIAQLQEKISGIEKEMESIKEERKVRRKIVRERKKEIKSKKKAKKRTTLRKILKKIKKR